MCPFPICPLYTQAEILFLDKPIADCFLFRPRKRLEKRKKRSHTNVFNASVIRTSRIFQAPLQTPLPCFHQRVKLVLAQSSAKRPTFAFALESGYTLGFTQRIAHNGSHAETWGFTLAIGGAFRSHSHIEAMKSRRKRMHALWRVSASYGAAAPLGCAASSAIWRCCFFSLCVRYFLHVRGKGGITTLGVLYMSSKRPMPACQNG